MMNRPGLNPQEAALLGVLVTCEAELRAHCLERIEPNARTALEAMCARFDELGDEARQEVLTRWQCQDAHSHGGRAHIAGLAPERVALHGSYLDERWARVMNLIVHAEDPLRPRLPAPYTLDVCAKVLMTELNLRQARHEYVKHCPFLSRITPEPMQAGEREQNLLCLFRL